MKKIMKNRLIFLLVASILLVSGCGNTQQTGSTSQENNATEEASASKESSAAETTEPVKVGYLIYMTGKYASIAKIFDTSVQLAVEDYNKTATIPIELIQEDAGDTPVSARSGLEKLLEKDPVAIIHVMNSVMYSGVEPLYDQAQKPVIHSNVLPSIFEGGYNWTFGINLTSKQGLAMEADYWKENLGVKKIAALFPNDDVGRGAEEALREAAEIYDLEIASTWYTSGDNDFSANITEARKSDPDLYFIYNLNATDFAKILKQMKQMGIEKQIATNDYLVNEDFLSVVDQEDVEGVLGYSIVPIDFSDPQIKEFNERYKAILGKDVDANALMSYDQTMMIFNAATKAGGDPQKIIEELHSDGYSHAGLSGTIKFDETGKGRHQITIVEIGPDKEVTTIERYTEAGY